MKKLQIAAVALMAMSMSLVSCSDKENATPTAELSAETPAFNIRYINVDTVLANYTLAKEFLAERQRVLIEYQTLENSKGNELQQEQNRIAQKYQSGGYLSEQSLQSDQQKLEQRANQTRNLLAQRQAKISQVMATQDSILNDSLRNFIRDLSRVNGITAVLDDKVTYYIDPALDITQAVIEGLNNRYKPAAPAAEPAKK